MKNEYEAVATIRSTPEAVWRVLTDAAGYATWNPEIVELKGRFAAGERIKARVKLGGGAIRSVGMRVTRYEEAAGMEWTGGLPFGLFIGRRTFTVKPGASGTEFRMHLSMTGPLAPWILKSVGDRQPEVDSFASALKHRVEVTRS